MSPEWVAALVALVVAVCAGLGWVLRWAWRILRRVVHFLDDYAGQPARDGRPAVPGFMARLSAVEEQLRLVVAETSPNHGTSLRDVVHQTAADMVLVKQQLERMSAP